MRPAARIQTAIEILDHIVAAARDQGASADVILADAFRQRRYAGGSDRRAIRDLVYRAIRRAGERPESGRAAMLGLVADEPELGLLFDGSLHAPAPIMAEEAATVAGAAPAWLIDRLCQSGVDEEGIAAMAGRAPLDLRVNRLKADVEAVMADLPEFVPTPHAADGLRGPSGFPIDRHAAFVAGLVEVQDEGSQIIVEQAAARPGMLAVDLCAGAGGKTLALAAAMAGQGRLIATDTDRGRLSRLPRRTERAGAALVETRLLNPGRELEMLSDLVDAADVVLVDAPCSGTGTWRRNPEARWRSTPERLSRLSALQSRLLDLAAELVRPGGRLVYAVCSLLDEEGAGPFAGFLDRHPQWRTIDMGVSGAERRGPGVRLSPATTGTDGFFIAGAEKPC